MKEFRCLSFVLLIVTSLILIGCKQNEEATVKSFMNANLHGKAEDAYQYLSASDKKTITINEYKEKYQSPIALVLGQKAIYKIVNTTTKADTAVVTVEITMPDASGMVQELIGVAFANAFNKDATPINQKEIADRIANKELPLKKEEQQIKLVKESAEWKVNLELEKKEQISHLMTEAEELRGQKKLLGALDKYNKVMELDAKIVEAQKASVEIQKDIASLEAKQSYIENIALYDLKSSYYSTYLDDKVPGVEFKLKNNGDRILKEVEVSVYFKDKDGNIISEKSYFPILNSTYVFRDNNKPLKPNYIWQMERGKFYKADSVPTEWKEGAVSAKITNIEFEE